MFKKIIAGLFVLASVCFSNNYIKDENGNSRYVHIEKGRKFFLNDRNDTIELGDFYRSQIEKEKNIYRNFSKRAFKKFSKMNGSDSVKVFITFTLPEQQKLLDQDLINEKSVESSYRHFSRKYGFEATKIGYRTFELYLKKRDIKKLIDDESISEIDIKDSTVYQNIERSSFLENFGYVPPSDPTTQSSVNAYHFTNLGYSGSGIGVGVLENAPMPEYYRTNYFNYSGFSYRPGTPASSPSNHTVHVASIIHNNLGHNSYFQAGGSYSCNLALGYPLNGEGGEIYNAYNWITSSPRNSKVMNVSITPPSSMVYNYSRFLDMNATNAPFTFNVVAAGNNGNLVEWNCNNCLIVGNVWPTRMLWEMSSWKNRTRGNEAPQVTAVGSGMSFITGSTSQVGTSFSTATVSSLASNTLSLFTHYYNYPEVLKAAIMASAIGRHSDAPFNPSVDTKSGFGVPNGEVLYRMSQNRFYYQTYSGQDGVASFVFISSLGTGSSFNRTLSVPAVSGNKKLNFVMTWFSNPEGTCVAGNDCFYDDLDITIKYSNGAFAGSSNSFTNTTEFVKINHSTAASYIINVNLKSRVTNKTIYGGLAWRITDN